ncbi:MAG: endolytic transglycosylase MltG [Bacteroidaceae bacterium]
MNQKKKRRVIIVIIAILVVLAIGTAFSFSIFGRVMNNEKAGYLFIDKDDNIDSVRAKIEEVGNPSKMTGFDILTKYTDYDKNIRIGRYKVASDISMLTLFRNLRNGQQTPVNLVVPNSRTIEEACEKIGKNLMLDSKDIKSILSDSTKIKQMGFTKETLPALFVPNTYEVYWTIEPEKLVERLKTEYDRFWDEERISKAKALELTPVEVATLASIVDSETAHDNDKPIIARLYLNRLEKHMRLASDPTVVFAVGDFSLRRVLKKHLQIDSPYNTYKYEGLPPGPIRIASIAGIDAVLNPDDNDYLFMCAKEDFSGDHYYTASEEEHMQNAKKYAAALNQRNIK